MWNASEGKLEVQLLDGGGDAALLQKMILLTFCAFGEIALPCSAVIDSRYNAEVLLGREPTGTLALYGRAGLVSGRADIFGFPNGEAGGACGVGPTELDMGPIAEADFLFEGADYGT